MRTLGFYSLILIAPLLFHSCAEKIDASSEDKFKRSVKEVKASLSDEKKKEFEDALKTIMFHGLDFKSIMQGEDSKKSVDNIRDELDGMTAEEVIEKGEKIKAKIEQKKKEQAKQEIKELYEQKELAAKHKEKLKQFKVKQSKFYKREKQYGADQPIIELTVKNGTSHAISRAYFKGTLASPNRSVPWVEEEFNYEISGGVEPGEEATWKLAPNPFSEWGQADSPNDAILTVKVLQLDGPDGESLFSLDKFDQDDQERLEALLEEYPEFAKK